MFALNPPNSFFWLDSGEDAAHIILGAVTLAAVFVSGLNSALMPYYKWIVVLVGVITLFFGVYGFIIAGAPVPNTFGVANLENPADNILHLGVRIFIIKFHDKIHSTYHGGAL